MSDGMEEAEAILDKIANDTDDDESVARARNWIAAAPDLLEALKLAVEEINELRRFANNNGAMINDEIFREGVAAIAKATGAPQAASETSVTPTPTGDQ